MSECPSCRLVRDGRPKFCENCGYQFASDTKTGAAELQPWGRVITPTKVLFALLFFAIAAYLKFGDHNSVSTTTNSRASTPRSVHVGDLAVTGGDHAWICGSTIEAFDEAAKWAGLADNPEMARSLAKTHSTLLVPRVRVKVLDSTLFMRKIRVLDIDKLSALLPPDKECWVPFEALTH